MARAYLNYGLKLDRKSLRGRTWSRVELICEQDRWWVDAGGKLHDVATIGAGYQLNLMRWLEASASRLKRTRFMGLAFSYGGVDYNGDAWIDDGKADELIALARRDDPLGWVQEQPLYRRLNDLLYGRKLRPGYKYPIHGLYNCRLADGTLVHSGNAEERFKKVVRFIYEEGFHPSPLAIKRELTGRATGHTGNLLNGRECEWRREVFDELGFKCHPLTGRYAGPA